MPAERDTEHLRDDDRRHPGEVGDEVEAHAPAHQRGQQLVDDLADPPLPVRDCPAGEQRRQAGAQPVVHVAVGGDH
jgi:hypothetical protein